MKGNANFSRNNFDCLRLILASIVVLFHSYALTSLAALSPFSKYLSPHFAIRGFFVISGLLIYRSYTRSSSISSYFEKRVRRIYPAYFTVIAVAAVALCALSTAPLARYFGGFGFWKYLGANLLFLNFLAPSLPGVFRSNIDSTVNGALWTLKIEVAFYIFVPLLHYLCTRFGTKKILATSFFLSGVWKYTFAWLAYIHGASSAYTVAPRGIYERLDVQFPAQLLYFIAGIFLLLYFDQLKFHFRTISLITAGLFLLDHFYTRGNLDVLWISGVVFVFGFWRYFGNFSKYGDFSYGVYIVHWPIWQALIALGFARLNPAIFLLVGLSLIGFAAFLMWHLVENRFLASSSHYRRASTKTAAQTVATGAD